MLAVSIGRSSVFSESMIASATNPWLLPIHDRQCYQFANRMSVRMVQDAARHSYG